MALGSIQSTLDSQDIPPTFLESVDILQRKLLEKSGDGDKTFNDLACQVGEILTRIKIGHDYYNRADENLKDPTISQDQMDMYMNASKAWKEYIEKAMSDWISIRERINEAMSSERKIVQEISFADPRETQSSLDPSKIR